MARWYVALGVVICGVLVFLAQVTGRHSSFPDAIQADLRTQRIAVRSVEVLHTWPDTVNNITYGANLRVVLTSGSVYWGRLDCLGWQKQCKYRLTGLQQAWIILPDLVAPSPMWEWWQRLVAWQLPR
jgi:hypothetical protein